MFFKYNKYDITEKNLYYLSMVAVLNFGIVVELIFVLGAIYLVSQEKQIDAKTIIYTIIIISFGFVFLGPDALIRKISLRKRIKQLNESLNIDMFLVLSEKKLSEKLIYKDDEWFVAVPSPECIIINRNYVRKDIEIRQRTKGIEVAIHTVDGETIEYIIDDKWKYIIEQLKKWMR